MKTYILDNVAITRQQIRNEHAENITPYILPENNYERLLLQVICKNMGIYHLLPSSTEIFDEKHKVLSGTYTKERKRRVTVNLNGDLFWFGSVQLCEIKIAIYNSVPKKKRKRIALDVYNKFRRAVAVDPRSRNRYSTKVHFKAEVYDTFTIYTIGKHTFNGYSQNSIIRHYLKGRKGYKKFRNWKQFHASNKTFIDELYNR